MNRAAWVRLVLVSIGGLGAISAGAGGCLGSGFVTDTTSTGSGGDASSSSGTRASSSASAGGGGAASSSSASSTSGASSSGMTGGENCFNGVDDDLDGKADCEDDDCDATTTCVPDAPPGWAGPFVVLGGAVNAPPDCELAWQANGSEVFKAGPIVEPDDSCACDCGPVDEPCNGTALVGGDTCASQGFPIGAAPDGTCVTNNALSAFGAVLAQKPLPNPAASCQPVSSGFVPPAQPTGSARVCAGIPAGGCFGDQKCMPALSGESKKVCVAIEGDGVECPAPYDAGGSTLLFTNITDTRKCGACSCGQPQQVVCGGNVVLYTEASCGGSTASIPANGSCTDLGQKGFVSYKLIGNGGGGFCGHSPASVSGSAIPEGPKTICCLP